MEALRKRFGEDEVLRGIDLSLNEGDVVCVIGSSGSGKTTLLRCITGLETADAGRISVGGRPIFDSGRSGKPGRDERRENQLCTGLVFQSFNLFPQYTVLQNVTLAARLLLREKLKKQKRGKKERARRLEELTEDARKVIGSVGLPDKLDAYPCELSGGQQQRVAIARALLLSPKLLCFDEPTSALDPEITGEVLGVIRRLAEEGRTLLIVTHELGFAREIADRLVFMDEGVIAEEGAPDELFDCPRSVRLRSFLNSARHL